LASIDLIEVLISDRETSNLVVVCCFRAKELEESSNEEHHQTVAFKAIDDLKKRGQETQEFNFTEVLVGNLAIPDLESLLSAVLGVGEQDQTFSTSATSAASSTATKQSSIQGKIHELAHVLQKKTHGNAFFLMQFLFALQVARLLTYSTENQEWQWDTTDIEVRTSATENVVDLMKTKIRDLPYKTCQLLQLAACLPSAFDERMLSLVWEAHCRSKRKVPNLGEDTVGISQLLASPVEQGLIEVVNGGAASASSSREYRWCHDKIQESAFALIPQAEVMDLQTQVGRVLVEKLDEQELEGGIFVVVNLLNSGSAPTNPPQQIRLAELNLQAARKAVRLSAFKSAEKFAVKGMNLLLDDRWKDHYQLTLELYSIAAEAESVLGHYDGLECHCREVLDQDFPLVDKLRLYKALMSCAYRRSQVQDAKQICLNVLRQLGCKFPSKKIFATLATVAGVLKIKATIKSRTAEDISRLPLMTDKKKAETIKLLDQLATFCYVSGDPLLPLVVFKSLRLTIKYGVCNYSPTAFALVGVIVSGALSDFQGGAMYGKQALLLVEKLNSKIVEARTIFVVHSIILQWTKPSVWALNPLLRAYELAMQTGDTESAFYAILQYIYIGFYSGKALDLLEAECRIYTHQSQDLKWEKGTMLIQIVHQMILNLMGAHQTENRAILKGEAMDQCFQRNSIDEDIDPLFLTMLDVHQNQLYALFGAYEECSVQAIEMGDQLVNQMPGASFLLVDPFFKGMSAFAMVRKTGRGKYRKLAMKSHKTLKDWSGKGNPNTIHQYSFLEGELAALQGTKHLATAHYEAAAGLAARGGFIHHAALIHRRYGEFLLLETSQREEALLHLQKAIGLFLEWGSQALADMILAEYGDLWPRPKEIMVFADEGGRSFQKTDSVTSYSLTPIVE
jgi:predicted ATPase